MPRGGTSGSKAQKGKGGKRRRNWHNTYGSASGTFDITQIRDMGTGADPTTAAPQPIRQGGRRYKGASL